MSTEIRDGADTNADRTSGKVALVVAAAFVVYALLAASSSFWDRDEPRFAQATVEMLASRDWIVPTFDGELRADKPILVYWLMAPAVAALGATGLAARSVSILAALAALLLVAHLARRWIGRTSAPLAAAILATSPLFLVEGTLATTDALLLVFVTGAVAAWAGGFGGRIDVARALVLGLCLGGAQLAKGPVGLALPVLAILVAHVLLRRARTEPRPPVGLGRALAVAVPIGIALFLAWAIPANARTGGEFLRRGLGHHVVERVSTPLEGHGGNFFLALPFYVPVLIVGFAPWSAFLPLAWARARRDASGRGTWLLLLGLSASTLVFMTLVATKLPHYVLPAWPALSIAVAASLRPGFAAPRWAVRTTLIAIVVLAAAEAAALVYLPAAIGLEADRWNCAAPIPALVIAAWFGARAVLRGRWERAAWILAAGRAAFFLLAAMFVLPAIETTKPAPRLAAAIRAGTSADTPVARCDFLEPSLDAYLDRPPIAELATDEEVAAWAVERAPGVLVVSAARWSRLRADGKVPELPVLARERGFNFGKGRRVDLLVVSRPGISGER